MKTYCWKVHFERHRNFHLADTEPICYLHIAWLAYLITGKFLATHRLFRETKTWRIDTWFQDPGSRLSHLIPQKCYLFVLGTRKEKVPVNCMKANWGRGNRLIAPLIRNFGTRWRWVVSWTHRPITAIVFAEVILNLFRLMTFNHLALNSYLIFSFSFHLGLLLHFEFPFFTLVTRCAFLWMNFQLSNRLRSRQVTFSWGTRLAIGTTFSVAAAVDVVSYFDK